MSPGIGVRARLQAGERLHGTMAMELFTPGLTAILADCGYDFLFLDMEHSGAGIDTIKQQIAYARGLPIEVWVRVPEKSYAAVATVLDAGAHGIMLPMVETAAGGGGAGRMGPLPTPRASAGSPSASAMTATAPATRWRPWPRPTSATC